jgi:hypothetical protein
MKVQSSALSRGGAGTRASIKSCLLVLSVFLLQVARTAFSTGEGEVEKEWIKRSQEVGTSVGNEDLDEDYYLYYYEETEEGSLDEATSSGVGEVPSGSAAVFDLPFLLEQYPKELAISQAKAFCNCTTRLETIELMENVRLCHHR